jgi:hypothetical protein
MVYPKRVRRKRNRSRAFFCRRNDEQHYCWSCRLLALSCVAILPYLLFFWNTNRTTTTLDSHRFPVDRHLFRAAKPSNSSILQHQKQTNVVVSSSSSVSTSNSTRYLIFRPPSEAAQGIGNLMNGLLATHALGNEFHRVVCVSPEWQDFFVGFFVLNPNCAAAAAAAHRTTRNSLWLINFGKLPVNECQLRQRLTGNEAVLYLVANTYPQWPTSTIDDTTESSESHSKNVLVLPDLQTYYRPRPELLEILPWTKVPPSTVVHLRQPDDPNLDPRDGLDRDTLQALGQTLPSSSSTFLVTNQVSFYDYFETTFGWSHPPWNGVHHSAKDEVKWGRQDGTLLSLVSKQQQLLELWSDWWTLYRADRVYHTHSDFSLSAVHWSGKKESYIIRGVDGEGKLRLEVALWKRNDDSSSSTTVLPFGQRSELQHCDLHPSGLDGLGYVLDLDDEYHDDLVDD